MIPIRRLIAACWAVALVAGSLLASVTNLDLSSNNLGPEGGRALAGSPNLAGLARLDLDGCAVGDAGGEALACSPHLGGLAILDLSRRGHQPM